jgi:diguanylate cyclase (GGDEF)-like protein
VSQTTKASSVGPSRPIQSNTILCIDDDPNIRDLVNAALELDGYHVILASNGAQGLQRAVVDEPHLIILDVMLPDMRGWDVLRGLKLQPRTASIPVIFLSALDETDDRVTGLALGADDYVGKPFAIKELLARVRTQLRHAEEHLLSELTGLPGNTQIERALKRTLQDQRPNLYVLYIDLDNFKSFNDAYGFLRGNDLIKLTAAILRSVVLTGHEHAFVGHVGGDDFVAILRTDDTEMVRICQETIQQFDAQVLALYAPEDRARGYVTTKNRQGVRQRFPIVTISIAVVTNRRRVLVNEYEVSDIAAQLKKQAKLHQASTYVVDQRAAD